MFSWLILIFCVLTGTLVLLERTLKCGKQKTKKTPISVNKVQRKP